MTPDAFIVRRLVLTLRVVNYVIDDCESGEFCYQTSSLL